MGRLATNEKEIPKKFSNDGIDLATHNRGAFIFPLAYFSLLVKTMKVIGNYNGIESRQSPCFNFIKTMKLLARFALDLNISQAYDLSRRFHHCSFFESRLLHLLISSATEAILLWKQIL